MKKINTIFFDLFGVLLGIDQSTIIHYVAQKIDLPYFQTKDIVMGEIFMKLERGEIRFKQYFQDLQYALPSGEKLSYDDFKLRWTSNKIEELPTVQCLPKLKKHYRLYIISNTSEGHVNSLRKEFKLFEKIEKIITSEAANSSKPSLEIFNYALNETDSFAESSIFIDDMASNVNVAKEMGFNTHHYKNYEGFYTFISSL
jgi:putative hydrolase of the HAD superfamily